MIKVTSAAAEQIKQSAKQGNMEGMPLRLAVKKNDDGSLHYGMGFDDQSRESDVRIESGGIVVVISAGSGDLVKGMEIDYVELSEGEFNFIFKNPNDPNYSPPAE